MEDKNELNDIILNKGSSVNNNKKIILAVATLGVILIVVVVLMNTLTSNGTDNLPQAVLPPKPKSQATQKIQEEPLFEEVEVVEEAPQDNDNLDRIAKKLKEESKAEIAAVAKPVQKSKPIITKPKPVAKVKKEVVQKTASVVKSTSGISYYIQVGSFSKYEPNKKFLKSISDLGYNYKYHKVNSINKVLVGPFDSQTKAKDARRILRAKVEPGAFLVKL